MDMLIFQLSSVLSFGLLGYGYVDWRLCWGLSRLILSVPVVMSYEALEVNGASLQSRFSTADG